MNIGHIHQAENWRHNHDFALSNRSGETRTRMVLWLTFVTMIAEIIAGTIFGSMALLADGWHMGTHVTAFLIAVFAYYYARKHATSPRYAFGAGKVTILGGFASAIALVLVALFMIAESIQRLFTPHAIQFNEAIWVAMLGLCVNLCSAWLLHDQDRHHHHEEVSQYHHDHNLRAAYIHVLADALTSVLAIIALVTGKYFGWTWMDPCMGIVGAVIITRWSWGLLRETGPILLDASIDGGYADAIRTTLEQDADNLVSDLHVWRVGANHYAAMISLVTCRPRVPEYYKSLLGEFTRLSHITIEVNECEGAACRPQAFNRATDSPTIPWQSRS